MPGEEEELENLNQDQTPLSDEEDNDDDFSLDNEDPDSQDEPLPANNSTASNTSDPEREALLRRAIEAETVINTQIYNRQRAEEQQRLENMSESERIRYDLEQIRTAQTNANNRMLFREQDMDDRASFLSMVSKSPKLAKYADEVEKELTTWRGKGQNYPREIILKQVIGNHAVKALMGGSTKKEKKQAQTNLNNAKTKAISSKGNVVNISKKSSNKYAHLENMHI